MKAYPMGAVAFPLRQIAEDRGGRIPERLRVKLWKERAARLTALRTESGRRIRVVYPGRSGVTAGPDFRDALLEVEGVGFVRGDVELHIRQKGGIPTVTAETPTTTVWCSARPWKSTQRRLACRAECRLR